nr:cell envelope biogenesis protein TolA [Candidatus Rhodoblastus alkanivorans]
MLAFLLVHFSHEQKFADAEEAVAVETITESQFHEIMQGEKTAPKADKPRADKVAERSEAKPTPPPPPPEAKRDVPVPAPPLRRSTDQAEADQTPPSPPTPPPRPAPPPPPVAKTPPRPPEQKQEAERKDAEAVRPPPRPKPPEKAERKPAPEPPPPEKPREKPEPKAKAEEKPTRKPPKPDDIAKLLADAKDKPAQKRKSSAESEHRRTPDLSEIAKLLDEKAPDAKFTSGREISRAAALGARHATGARMSPSMSDSLNALLQEQYKQCWNYLPLTGDKYVARIHVTYRPDGSLAGQPVLLNPPSNPQFRGLAESAVRAVRRCNPLRIPAQYLPYYDQWKDWVVGFDPEILN